MDKYQPPLLLDVSSPAGLAKNEGGEPHDYGSSGHDLKDEGVVHVMVNPETVTDPVFLIYCQSEYGGMDGICAMLNYKDQEAAQAAYVEMHGEEAIGFTVETSVEDYRKLVEMTTKVKEGPQSGDYHAEEFQSGYGQDPRKKRYYY